MKQKPSSLRLELSMREAAGSVSVSVAEWDTDEVTSRGAALPSVLSLLLSPGLARRKNSRF